MCLQILFDYKQYDAVKALHPSPVLPVLSTIHAYLPLHLSVTMCHHWCFPFHLGFHLFMLLFHTNVLQRRFITAASHYAIYLCYMAKIPQNKTPDAFVIARRPEWSIYTFMLQSLSTPYYVKLNKVIVYLGPCFLVFVHNLGPIRHL